MVSPQSSLLPSLGDGGSESLGRVPEELQGRLKEEAPGRTEGEQEEEEEGEKDNNKWPVGPIGGDMGGSGQNAGGEDETMADLLGEEAKMKECSLRQVSFKNKACLRKHGYARTRNAPLQSTWPCHPILQQYTGPSLHCRILLVFFFQCSL